MDLLLHLQKLSRAEKLLLVQQLWDEIAEESESTALTQSQKEELDRRLARLDAEPDEGKSWAETTAWIRQTSGN